MYTLLRTVCTRVIWVKSATLFAGTAVRLILKTRRAPGGEKLSTTIIHTLRSTRVVLSSASAAAFVAQCTCGYCFKRARTRRTSDSQKQKFRGRNVLIAFCRSDETVVFIFVRPRWEIIAGTKKKPLETRTTRNGRFSAKHSVSAEHVKRVWTRNFDEIPKSFSPEHEWT